MTMESDEADGREDGPAALALRDVADAEVVSAVGLVSLVRVRAAGIAGTLALDEAARSSPWSWRRQAIRSAIFGKRRSESGASARRRQSTRAGGNFSDREVAETTRWFGSTSSMRYVPLA